MAWYNKKKLRIIELEQQVVDIGAEAVAYELVADTKVMNIEEKLADYDQRFKLYKKTIEDRDTQIGAMEQHIMRLRREKESVNNQLETQLKIVKSQDAINDILTNQKQQLQGHRNAWRNWCLEIYEKCKGHIPAPRRMKKRLSWEK